MNSAYKPGLTATGPQNSPLPSQLNKPMHPQQVPPATYGQPSNHIPPSMVNLPHGNTTAAHSHPPANHYSLNVPNAGQHYMSNSQPIPASNHPVPNNPSQSSPQIFGAPKNIPYPGAYQPNLGHPPNQNALPPVSQTLPATNSPSQQQYQPDMQIERPQSNGTPETKSESQDNHVTLRPASPAPQLPPQVPDKQAALPEKIIPEAAEAASEEDSVEAPTSSSTSENVVVPSVEQSVPPIKPASPTPSATSVSSATSLSCATPEPSTAPASEPPVPVSNATSTTAEKATPPEETVSVEKKPRSPVAKDVESIGGTLESEEKESISSNPSLEKSPTADGADVPNSAEPPVPKPKEPNQKAASTSKLVSTPRMTSRKPKSLKVESESPKTPKSETKLSPVQKAGTSTGKVKRARIRTQPYQSPLPELEIISKISASTSTPRNKNNDDKLIVFYKNEFLAVRNSEGSFYICQAVQNIYKSSGKIRIRWLSQDKSDKNSEMYTPDFYDNTDFDCILTNLNMVKVDKGKFKLPPAEQERTASILKRSLAAEKGEEIPSPSVTEEHPDGLDLSLYKEESQLQKRKSKKRKATSPIDTTDVQSTPKKSPDLPKVPRVVPKSAKKATPKKPVAIKRSPIVESKKSSTSGTRTDRAKRRNDVPLVSKVSPKVDPKKAKVLAKVARKTAVPASKFNSSPSSQKSTKITKPAPTPPQKAKTPPSRAASRKTKRSSRK